MKSKLYLVGKQFVGRTGIKLALIGLASALAGHSALAATPTMQAESATLSGASNTVVITRVPTTTATGAVKYWNITLQFNIDGVTGTPTLTPLFPTIVTSPSVAVGNFKPGTYKDGLGNKYKVGGPNIVAGGAHFVVDFHGAKFGREILQCRVDHGTHRRPSQSG